MKIVVSPIDLGVICAFSSFKIIVVFSLVLSHGVIQAFTNFFNLFQLQPKTTDKKEEEKK